MNGWSSKQVWAVGSRVPGITLGQQSGATTSPARAGTARELSPKCWSPAQLAVPGLCSFRKLEQGCCPPPSMSPDHSQPPGAAQLELSALLCSETAMPKLGWWSSAWELILHKKLTSCPGERETLPIFLYLLALL